MISLQNRLFKLKTKSCHVFPSLTKVSCILAKCDPISCSTISLSTGSFQLIPLVMKNIDCHANFQSLEFLVENCDYAEKSRA